MDFSILSDLRCLGCEISYQALRFLGYFPLIIILTVLIALLIPIDGYVLADTNIKFEQITADQGLSQSGILCILQDSQGFMWFGTQDGLNKYDGYKFTVYKYDKVDPHSLSDNLIASIYEDRSGVIWVGTDNGGLNKFDRKTEKFTRYTHHPDNPNSLGNNRVLSIYEDKSGNLWIGTDGGGLEQFNRATEQFTHYRHNPNDPQSLGNNTIFSIYEDHLGTLWIGTNGGGLNQFDRKTEKFIRYTNNPHDLHSLSKDAVLSIYEDHAGRVWIGTKGGGLNRFERETGQFTRYLYNPIDSNISKNNTSNNTVSSIVEDQYGNLWLGTANWYINSYGTGLNKFNPQTGEFTNYTYEPTNPNSLNDTIVGSLYRDQSGILWIGTGFGGINKLDQKGQKFTHYKNDPADADSLSSNHIMSLYEDHFGKVWIGTSDGGLNQLDRTTGKFTHYRHDPNNPNSLSSDNVWSTYEDQQGVLWVGTFGGGLNKFDRETGKFTHYRHDPNNPYSLSDNTVVSLYEDRSGTFWIGTFSGGLNKFNRETEQFTHYKYDPNDPHSLSDNLVWSIYEDQEGTLWIGGYGQGGLNKFNRDTGEFTRYKHDPNDPNSLSYDRIDAIYEDSSGSLWIGTYGGGLNKFNQSTEKFTHYTLKDGLPNDAISGILGDDQGNLWLSTNRGITKFNIQAETFRNYDVNDGLQGNEFDGVKAYFKSRTGEMFFGGLNGFNSFFPERVKDNPYIPPISLTDFKKFNESVKLDTAISETKIIHLTYKENFFGLEFTALDYTDSRKNKYAYKLEGFDKDWIYTGTTHYATYTNLDGGTYLFRVKGSNNDGVWNEQGAAIKIIITPPPWKTWWAYTLYGVGLSGAVLGYTQLKTRAQEMENAALRDSERRLIQFLEAIPLGIKVINTTGQFVYVNQTASQLIGKGVSLNGFPDKCSDVTNQVYIAGTEQLYPYEELPLIRALRGERTFIDNLEIHSAERVIPVEAWGTPIYDDQGTIIYAVVAFQDISSRKQAETALRESEERFRAIFEQAAVGISLVSPSGQFLRINERYCNLLGYTQSEMLQLTFQNITYPDDLPADLEQMGQLYAGKISTFSMEKRYICKEGQLKWVNLTVSLLQDSTGVPQYTIGVIEDIQERKHTESALRQSEQRYRAIVESQTELICRYLPDTTLTFVNDAYCHYFGVSGDQLIGESFMSLIPVDDHLKVKEYIISFSLENPLTTIEHRVVLPNGEIRWLQWTDQAIFDEFGQLSEFQCTGQDITERKRAEEALRLSEKRFRLAVEHFPGTFVIYDAQRRLQFVNAHGVRIGGLPESALLGRTDEEIHPPEVTDHYLPLLKQAVETRTFQTGECTIQLPTTGEITFIVSYVPLLGERGEIYQILGITQEITDRKWAQEALKAQHELLQTVIDTNPNLIFVKDRDSRFVLVNQAFADFYEKPVEELLGKLTLEVHPHPTEAQEFIFEDREVFTTLEPKFIPEQVCHSSTGEVRWFQVIKKPVLSSTGQACQVFCVCTDITERKLAEIQLKESLQEKEFLLQEIHHRVKNNLQIICSLLDLQSQNLTEDKTLEIFRDSYNRVKSMALIHEKLYQSATLAKINFAEYVETLTTYLSQSYGINPDLIEMKINIELVFLNIDTAIPSGLIINELVSNSLKYAFPGKNKGLLEIDLHCDSEKSFILTVKDNGVGFPEHINFQNTTTLGLQLIKVLTKQLEGEIQFNQNQGTEFKIRFFEIKN